MVRISLKLPLRNSEYHSHNLYSLQKHQVDVLNICGKKPQDVGFSSWACLLTDGRLGGEMAEVEEVKGLVQVNLP